MRRVLRRSGRRAGDSSPYLPAVFESGVEGAGVAGEELGLVGGGGVFDDAGGRGVVFIEYVAGFEEAGEAARRTIAAAEAGDGVGIGGEGVAEIDVGFFWRQLEGGAEVEVRGGFPGEFAADQVGREAGEGVVGVEGIVVELQAIVGPGGAEDEAVGW